MVDGALLIIFTGFVSLHEYGPVALLLSAFGLYLFVILFSFAAWPNDVPWFTRMICVGNMEEEFYALVWPPFEDIPPDRIDKTWRLPAVIAMVEFVTFFSRLLH